MFGDGLQDLISDKGQSGIESNFIDLKVQLLNAINDGLDQRWESRFGDSQVMVVVRMSKMIIMM